MTFVVCLMITIAYLEIVKLINRERRGPCGLIVDEVIEESLSTVY
jgi:hypothetical protein